MNPNAPGIDRPAPGSPAGGSGRVGIVYDPPASPGLESDRGHASRYRGLPVVFLAGPGGEPRPCPYLMSLDDLVAFLRLHEARTRFPLKTIERYRQLGLRSVRVGRCRWFTLPDVLDFLDRQQARVGPPG